MKRIFPALALVGLLYAGPAFGGEIALGGVTADTIVESNGSPQTQGSYLIHVYCTASDCGTLKIFVSSKIGRGWKQVGGDILAATLYAPTDGHGRRKGGRILTVPRQVSAISFELSGHDSGAVYAIVPSWSGEWAIVP